MLPILALALALQAGPDVPGAALAGQVVDSVSGEPVAGAEVTLIPAQPPAGPRPLVEVQPLALTDDQGRYRFEDVPAGPYRVMVRKPAYAAANSFSQLTLTSGEERAGLNLTLQRGAVIPGRVVDENGEPVVNAHVFALRKSDLRPVMFGDRIVTNDLGEFRLFGVPTGDFYVQANPPSASGGGFVATGGVTMMPTYFPNASTLEGAQVISLAAGETAGAVEIRMTTALAFRVSGVAVDEAGNPIFNALITLRPDRGRAEPPLAMGGSHTAHTDASGSFVFNNVAAGRYLLVAIAPMTIPIPARGATGGARGEVFSVSGIAGGGVTTEIANGIATQYRDAAATRLSIAVDVADITTLEVVVRKPR